MKDNAYLEKFRGEVAAELNAAGMPERDPLYNALCERLARYVHRQTAQAYLRGAKREQGQGQRPRAPWKGGARR